MIVACVALTALITAPVHIDQVIREYPLGDYPSVENVYATRSTNDAPRPKQGKIIQCK